MHNITTFIYSLDSAAWTTIMAIIGLLLISAFFSGSETALTAASRGKLHAKADRGSKGAKRALLLTENSERLIGAILLGNNLVNILAAALATSLFTQLFGDSGVAIATLVMTIMVLIFAEVLPKTYAIANAETAASIVSAPIRVLIIILAPFVGIVQLLVRSILRVFGIYITRENHFLAAQEELAGAIALNHSQGNFEKEDRDRLLGALDLKDRVVKEIMLHRSKIEIIDISEAPKNILLQCLNSRYTRLPVFKDDPENIVGVVHAKDLLRAVNHHTNNTKVTKQDIKDLDIMKIIRAPYFVPETTPLDEQMREFLRRQTHFALVVDEYGALQGLITLEDILEEIVGEITDEYDENTQEIALKDQDGNYTLDGNATLRDINRSYDWNLPDEEANTIAGLVIHEAQIIPQPKQVFYFHGFRFEIMNREKNRITTLKVRKL